MILLLGSDGYIGMEFFNKFHKHYEIKQIDNFYKRRLLENLSIKPLYPVKANDDYFYVDMANYDQVKKIIIEFKPDAIIHLAEQPSAPYSMASHSTAIETLKNNLMGTMNLIYCIRDYSPNTHIVKLGTMGEYGCPNVPIPEGWFDCVYKGRSDRLLFPKNPHSIYHLTKVFDSDALAFACKTWGLKVTDLNQGFVYGSNGSSRYCYDDMFGTVFNRFLTQAVTDIPLTIYGSGGQKRGMIHINDSVECLRLAAENPANEGEFRVANQLSEWDSIDAIAKKIQNIYGCKIDNLQNPRQEKEEHFYEVEHTILKDYGFKPQLLCDDLIKDQFNLVKKYKENININQIYPRIRWRF